VFPARISPSGTADQTPIDSAAESL
jgi:hypothetical protein